MPGSPSLAVRQQLVRAQWAKDDVVDAEDAHRMQLLLQIVALQQAAAACDPTSAERMAALLNLVPGREQLNDVAGHKRMQGHLQAACNGQPPLSFPEIAQLVARDAVNAFGIEVPGSDEVRTAAWDCPVACIMCPRTVQAVDRLSGAEIMAVACRQHILPSGLFCAARSCLSTRPEHLLAALQLRGSALYARASMVNHACLPTIARVDHFDSDGPHRTHLQLRTLHALPAGEEALLSYVPLPWPLKERQVQCKDVYEFECCCPRCVCEQIEDTEEARLAAGLEDGLDGSYVHMFLMKYVCTQSDCFGTLVPAAQRDDGLAVCNVCGRGRTLEQFMAELTAGAE